MGSHSRCRDSRCGCSCHRVNFASDIESVGERLCVGSVGCSHDPLLGPFTPPLGLVTSGEQSIESNGSRAWLNALWAQRTFPLWKQETSGGYGCHARSGTQGRGGRRSPQENYWEYKESTV